MEEPVRFGVELAVGPGTGFGRVAELAGRIAGEGWGVLWVSGWPDPCTLVGALSAGPVPDLVGVVAELPAGRHPAVLARELASLDVLTGGRAAVMARWRPPPDGVEETDPERYLAEAAEIYRRVCSEESAVFDGAHLRVAGARSRPAPLRPGGPPIVVECPPGHEPAEGPIDGVVVGAAALAATRRRFDARPGSGGPALLWRARPEATADDVRAARDAGAQGVVVAVRADAPYRGLAGLAGAWSA